MSTPSKTSRPTPNPIVTTPSVNAPRPLHLPHLVDSDPGQQIPALLLSSQASPAGTPLPSSTTSMSHSTPSSTTELVFHSNAPKTRPSSLKVARRQSSISYLPPDSERHWRIRSPTVPTSAAASESESGSASPSPALSRSVSLSSASRSKLKEARRSSFDPRPERAAAALTLAEKHADLLHFIAQKESKCLELRSQLSSHEAELLQLKQKWERIVNRDFGKALSSTYSPSVSNTPSTPSTNGSSNNTTQQSQGHSSNGASASSTNHGNGAVFDGFVEGMQGMGRLIAAGLTSPALSSSGASSPAVPSSISRAHAPSSSSARSSTLGRRIANGHGHGRGHAAHMSTSSTSTAATGSTSMSGSTRLSQSSASSLGMGDEPILGVHKEESDTEDQVGSQELMVRDTGATPTLSPNPKFIRRHSQPPSNSSSPVSISPPPISLASSKLHRRRSREAPPLVSLDEAEPELKSQDVKMPKKRSSLSGMQTGAAQTPTSIPGIGSLSAMGAQGWVGSVGKKFEDLQNGKTFSKGSKRASLLLSDVFAALSSPSPSATPFAIVSPSTENTPSTPPVRRNPSHTSLMDDDDDDLVSLGASVLTPDSTAPVTPVTPKMNGTGLSNPAKPMRPLVPTRAATTPAVKQSQSQAKDDEDEWNW